MERVECSRGIIIHVHPVVGLQGGVRHDGSISLVLRLGCLHIFRILDRSCFVAVEKYKTEHDEQSHNDSGPNTHASAQVGALLALNGGQFASGLLATPSPVVGALAQVLPYPVIVWYTMVLRRATIQGGVIDHDYSSILDC